MSETDVLRMLGHFGCFNIYIRAVHDFQAGAVVEGNESTSELFCWVMIEWLDYPTEILSVEFTNLVDILCPYCYMFNLHKNPLYLIYEKTSQLSWDVGLCWDTSMKIYKYIFIALTSLMFHVKPYEASEAETNIFVSISEPIKVGHKVSKHALIFSRLLNLMRRYVLFHHLYCMLVPYRSAEDVERF